jgi:hypothetical protein
MNRNALRACAASLWERFDGTRAFATSCGNAWELRITRRGTLLWYGRYLSLDDLIDAASAPHYGASLVPGTGRPVSPLV